MIPVVEIFGPTIQGEGPAAGRNAAFLRLGGCNLSCSWCDTAYSWDGQRFDLRAEITMMTVARIMDALPPSDLLIVTGGEPLLHQGNPDWPDLMRSLGSRYAATHLETNGTIEPADWTLDTFDLMVVSPKLPNAGAHRGHQDPTPWAGWPLPGAVLKVVVQTAGDVDDAIALADQWGWPRHGVWVMPEGQTADELQTRWPAIFTTACAAGINVTHRLHILAVDNRREENRALLRESVDAAGS